VGVTVQYDGWKPCDDNGGGDGGGNETMVMVMLGMAAYGF
jgi:hypothetical protein